jgi:alpha-galactosidase
MKRTFLLSILISVFALCCQPMYSDSNTQYSKRPNIDRSEGQRIFNELLCKPNAFPISFTYNGKDYNGLGNLELINKDIQQTVEGKTANITFALDKNIQVKVVAKYCAEYGETEYTVWFENTGVEISAVLENLLSVNMDFKGSHPVLRGCLGDHKNNYAPYNKNLLDGKVDFRSDGGRATHIVFPYFDLVHGNGGTLLALGWAGTWSASFVAEGSKTIWKALNCNEFKSVLKPGEKIRTALVVMLPYKGRNGDDAANLWREWFQKYNMPRANANKDFIKPFSTECFASDTGLPNSDGSVSERFYTWRRTLDRILYENVKADFRWIDAGWYFDPAGKTVMSRWWATVGSWELDTIKWPKHTFRESNEACHKVGMKTFLWFEPERVTHVDDLVKNYGYKAEWAISNGSDVFSNNIGIPECRKWTVDRITKVMKENEIDFFREDNNSDPGKTWPKNDGIEEKQMNLPRHGMTENKAIQGHYAMWDDIISFCAKNGKLTFIDNCASGGGRNDIESLRRSFPVMRSDADRTTTALRLSMSSTFCKWVPFHGANTKESVNQLEAGKAGGSDLYTTRASWLPVYNISEVYTHDVLLDYDNLRKTFGEWKKYSHLLTKDFYVLTPWHSEKDTNGWTAFVYNDVNTGEGILTAFRQEKCNEPLFVAKLPFAKPKKMYKLQNIDTGEELMMKGSELCKKGISIKLDKPRECAVWHFYEQ